jgi:hypothetical protein
MTDSTSGGYRIPTRVCLQVTKERQRSTRFGEGSSRSKKPRGVRILGAQQGAGLRGAPHRDRLKLATANSFVDPPLL